MHIPVLVEAVVSIFTNPGTRFITDATIGLGGHSEALLESIPNLELLGIDLDSEALSYCRKRLEKYAERICLRQGNYSRIREFLDETGWKHMDGILADLGVSSMQLARPERGFSFSQDGPLDMRMGNQDVTAEEILNTWDETALTAILKSFGEVRMAHRISQEIVNQRPIDSTSQLRQLIHRVRGSREGSIDSATKIFQALRIAVNQELSHLEAFIPEAIEALGPGGRLAIISFHSLEDRIVKTMFNRFAGRCVCPPGVPGCTCNPVKAVTILSRKPVVPSAEEIRSNPASRSSKLRVVEKL